MPAQQFRKFVGKGSPTFRSSWEIAYARRLDTSPTVKAWLSEPKMLNIKYYNPINKRMREYWPDFMIEYVNGYIELVEIKPLKEALAENARNTYDKLMLIQNITKWQAADKFAKAHGWGFRVVTEAQLFAKTGNSTRRAKSTSGTVNKARGTRGTRK